MNRSLDAAARKGRSARYSNVDGPAYSAEELEFIRAMDAYKTRYGRIFPTCCEVLAVAKALGYVRADVI